MGVRIKTMAVAMAGCLLAGCTAPPATVDLITVARKGLAMAKEAQASQHTEIVRHLESQSAALDSAFDADVRLAAAGQIKTADGQVAAFTPEWVISARKGYAAARDAMSTELRSAESANTARSDNLKAADEALDMASQLIVQQYSVSEQIKQQLINVQRSLLNGK